MRIHLYFLLSAVSFLSFHTQAEEKQLSGPQTAAIYTGAGVAAGLAGETYYERQARLNSENSLVARANALNTARMTNSPGGKNIFVEIEIRPDYYLEESSKNIAQIRNQISSLKLHLKDLESIPLDKRSMDDVNQLINLRKSIRKLAQQEMNINWLRQRFSSLAAAEKSVPQKIAMSFSEEELKSMGFDMNKPDIKSLRRHLYGDSIDAVVTRQGQDFAKSVVAGGPAEYRPGVIHGLTDEELKTLRSNLNAANELNVRSGVSEFFSRKFFVPAAITGAALGGSALIAEPDTATVD